MTEKNKVALFNEIIKMGLLDAPRRRLAFQILASNGPLTGEELNTMATKMEGGKVTLHVYLADMGNQGILVRSPRKRPCRITGSTKMTWEIVSKAPKEAIPFRAHRTHKGKRPKIFQIKRSLYNKLLTKLNNVDQLAQQPVMQMQPGTLRMLVADCLELAKALDERK